MSDIKPIYLNTGIYSVTEAARLTKVSGGRIRRWLRGYKFYSHSTARHSPALWPGQLDPLENNLALGFLDLIEIKFVDSFLKAGVSWTMLRQAHEIGTRMFKQSHPFCTHHFTTDGRAIFAELREHTEEKSLLEIAKQQKVFYTIVSPFFKELEFDEGDVLARWRPMTARRLVVLDPTRSFGHPIVAKHGIPTEWLASAASRGSVAEVSRWYELPGNEVEDAIEFEQKLAE